MLGLGLKVVIQLGPRLSLGLGLSKDWGSVGIEALVSGLSFRVSAQLGLGLSQSWGSAGVRAQQGQGWSWTEA